MKPSFVNATRPLVVGMTLKRTPNEAIYAIKNCVYAGADAVAVQLCKMEKQYKTKEELSRVFAAAAGRPIYVTDYRWNENAERTYEECAEELVMAMEAGGTLADVPGDFFCEDKEYQMTDNEEAIGKQMALIDRLHALGKEVLMSAHVLRFLPAEKVLEIAKEQVRRGADIVKIVTGANSEEEEMENLRIAALLKKELSVPFILLAAGTHAKILRMIGPCFGCFGVFAVYEHDSNAVLTQPTVAAARAVLDHFDYLPDLAVLP
ncbi:MAG: type I 3-dehydroquinate dehydratase [Clostridia bacterium]|nr:type I 3-dehydroquinate dehydratase [Clostridia bacterium]